LTPVLINQLFYFIIITEQSTMANLSGKMKLVEEKWALWLDKHAIDCLRISIGIIYLAFGVLKFFPNYSPAERLAGDTICLITFDLISGTSACFLLAILESAIGVALLINVKQRAVILITLWHMCCTFLPLFMLPHYAYNADPFSFSIVGQYIFKNLIIVSALLVLYKNQRAAVRKELTA
jgi:uncharacterized membrane protein YkgB